VLYTLILNFLFLIGLGFLSRRAGLFKAENARILNKFIIYFALPALTFKAIIKSHFAPSLLKLPLLAIIVAFSCLLAAIFIAKIFRFRSAGTVGGFFLASTVGNTAYMGYPVTEAVYGSVNLTKAIFYDLFGTFIFLFTIGLYIAGRYGEIKTKSWLAGIREILIFPPLLALFAGFIFKGIVLPEFFLKSVDYLAASTVPLIMFSIGLSLRLGEIGKYKLLLVLVCLIKLVLSPALAFFIGRTISLSSSALGVSVLQASMPSALMTLVLGLEHKLDTSFLSTAVLVTTLLSFLTISIGQYLISVF